MTETQDIRWKQRFDNFVKALKQLSTGIKWASERQLNEMEQQGIIQSFEYTHELAWNMLKDYLEEKGFLKIIGSKDTTREAFRQNIIHNGEIWMEMIKSRNLSSHTYNLEMANDLVLQIKDHYYPVFIELEKQFLLFSEEENG